MKRNQTIVKKAKFRKIKPYFFGTIEMLEENNPGSLIFWFKEFLDKVGQR